MTASQNFRWQRKQTVYGSGSSPEIERHVELRANRQPFPVKWTKWFAGFKAVLRAAWEALGQLDHVEELSESAELDAARGAARELAAYANTVGRIFSGPPNPSVISSFTEPAFNIAGLFAQLKQQTVAEGVRPHRDALARLCDQWDERPFVSRDIAELQQPSIFLADAGAGKTHACAHLVHSALDRNEPAVVVRARNYAPASDNWTSILLHSLEETGLSVEELLDALLAAARLADVRRAVAGDDVLAPCRPIILIDGLDESVGAIEWIERLRELPSVLGDRRVVFGATSRGSLVGNKLEGMRLSVFNIEGSDPDLHQLFETYIEISDIQAPPVLRWWLRSPLAVRLFADVFAGARREVFADLTLGIHELVRRKIALVAGAASGLLGVSVGLATPIIRGRLLDFGKRLLTRGGALSNDEALACLRGSDMAIAEPLRLLQIFRDRGILVEIPSFEVDPLKDKGPTWDFAFATLHSYVIASSYAEEPRAEALPYLRAHPQTLLFSIVLREDSGHDTLLSNDWSEGLSERDARDVRLAALSLMKRSRAVAHADFARDLLTKSMPCCRSVIDALVFPGLRISGYPFGARFVSDALIPFSVAERDKFWSGPPKLALADGHPWEGVGRKAFEGQSISNDDSWDSAPLLLLMSCASVDESHRRYMVYQLAQWGARNPDRITELAHWAFGSFNDPQVLEDLANAIWSASCLKPDADWVALRETIHGTPWTRAFPRVPSLRFLRYCELFLTLTGGAKTSLRFAVPDVLPIDPAVGTSVNKHSGFGPIRGDFTWYVVPSALRDFDAGHEYGNSGADTGFEDEWQWDREKWKIFEALVDRRIRVDAPQEEIERVRGYLDALGREVGTAEPAASRRARDAMQPDIETQEVANAVADAELGEDGGGAARILSDSPDAIGLDPLP